MMKQQPLSQTQTQTGIGNNQSQGQSLRKKYTSHNEEMPGQLSYQNIKLANFIELELADLWDSLQHINRQNYKNQLKESLSRSYNVFHEMKKLYNDLGMNFLYSQSKKLISSYGIIFVYLMERVDEYEKFRDDQSMRQTIQQKVKADSFQEQVKRDIENYKIKKCEKDTKKHKRMGGIHLFNQSYARRIDYDVEAFRQLRESMKQKSQQEKEAIKLEQDRKFKKEVMDEINDYSYLKVDGEELYMFLNRHQQNVNEITNKICLGDELEKIAGFFKESQHQALQFLRKQKNLQNFHELTEGFNSIVSDYELTKANQIFLVKDKIKQIFDFIQSKIQHLLAIIEQRDKEILLLKQTILKKNVQKSEAETQTFYNFDDQIKPLYRRILTAELLNQELKVYITKTGEEQRKQKLTLLQQIGIKETANRQIKQVLEQKLGCIVKLQRKARLLAQSNKSKNVKDPIEYFNSLSSQMKKYFFEELKEQGFIHANRSEDRNSYRSSTKQHSAKVSEMLPFSPFERRDHILMGEHRTQSPHHESRKRESSFYRKTLATGSNFYRENQVRATDNQRKSGHLHFVIPQQDQASSNQTSQNERARQSDKEPMVTLKSKKIISIRPTQNQVVEKVRVFDIQDRSGGFNYSQKCVDFDSKSQSKLKSSYDLKDKNQKQIGSKGVLSKSRKKLKDNDDQQQQTNENDKKSELVVNFSSKKFKKYYQTGGVTENELEQSIDYNQNSQIKLLKQNKNKQYTKNNSNNQEQSNDNLNVSSMSKSRSKSKHNRNQQQNQYSSQEQQSNGTTAKNIRSQKSARKMRPSCQLAIDQENQQKNQRRKQVKAKSRIQPNQQAQAKNSQKCSIFLEYNMIVSTPPYGQNSDKEIVEHVKNNMKELQQKWQYQLKKQINTPGITNLSSVMQKMENSQKQSMNTTMRKQKQKTLDPKNIGKQNSTQIDNRKTKSNLRNNTCVTVNNTFHKNNDRVTSLNKQNANILQQTHQSFGMRTSQSQANRLKYLNHQKSLSKTKSMIRSSQHKDSIFRIEAEFADEEVAVASRECETLQQFKQKVATIHFAKCGPNCRHLQRYIDIFNKLKKNIAQNQRKLIKVHIENMNEKLSLPGGYDQLALPTIGRK